MNLDTARWDGLLAGALTVPGQHDLTEMIADAPFDWREWATAEWSAEQALQRLGLHRVEWPTDMPKTVASGMCKGDAIALNPMARNKIRTVAHELAHAVFDHSRVPQMGFEPIDAVLRDLAQARTPIHEFEADCTALLVCFALGQDERELSICRAYIQEFTKVAVAIGLPKTWADIKRVAQRILAAGASTGHQFGPSVRPKPKPVHVDDVQAFIKRVQWSRS